MLSKDQLASDRNPAVTTLEDRTAEVALYWQRRNIPTPALDHLTGLVIAAAQRFLPRPGAEDR